MYTCNTQEINATSYIHHIFLQLLQVEDKLYIFHTADYLVSCHKMCISIIPGSEITFAFSKELIQLKMLNEKSGRGKYKFKQIRSPSGYVA